MKRMICAILIIFGLIPGFTGCAPEYSTPEEAQAAGASLGECIFIDGVNVSGLTPVQAADAVEKAHTEALKSIFYTVNAQEDSVEISASLLPVAFNTKEVIVDALGLKRHWPAGNEPRRLYTSMSADPGQLKDALSEQTGSLSYAAENAAAAYDAGAEGRFAYTEHKTGRTLDLDDLCKKIGALISSGCGGTAEAMTSPVQPEYTAEMARADTQLISEFSTSFAKKSHRGKNRVYNITKAASMIDGKTLMSGEEFDMNAALGDRNKKNGWRTAAAIKDGSYVQEYGGGVCQVSTTLYNAVLMADLEVTERYHHSWPLGYIDIGRDATISTGGPNFKFKNTAEAPITISAAVSQKEKTITVRIYGRPLQNGIRIEIASKKVRSLYSPGTKTIVDSSLPPGVAKTVRQARRGSVSRTHKLYYGADGELIKKELVSEDEYRSIEGLVSVSPCKETAEG